MKLTRKDLINLIRHRELTKLQAEEAAAREIYKQAPDANHDNIITEAVRKRTLKAFTEQPHIKQLTTALRKARVKFSITSQGYTAKPGHVRINVNMNCRTLELKPVFTRQEKQQHAETKKQNQLHDVAREKLEKQLQQIEKRRQAILGGDVLESVISAALATNDAEIQALLAKLDRSLEAAVTAAVKAQ